ncbi:cysteine desulfuration protein SufE [Brevibacterium ravenspurgense]|uniref:Cysteine desulfuration protein SufE n=1 Tax=Brevibacterium ravenspurgense TaxID=479117 RepID=A0A2I1IJ51_9MICO|nr:MULTISPECIES: SufE family protein [Brevibacterium]OFT92584.1 cysteine desufuration protein SufE [Brevibacterium sp. HMSC24B04]PKY71154.1 cysteine desulfuration protein SufE [Brevibacterium ravenspurgense]
MTIPQALQEIADDFGAMEESQRLELLLEFSDELPDLPQRLKGDPKLLEPVPECQSPIFIRVEVDGTQPDSTVHLFFSAPAEAPTTRGFAGILNEGLDGATVQTVLDVPADFPLKLNIEKQVSPLRLNGMSGMLARIQRQVREKAQQ